MTTTADPLVRAPGRMAALEYQLNAAKAEIRALRHQINGAAFIVDQFDPASGMDWAAQFQVDLRAALAPIRTTQAATS